MRMMGAAEARKTLTSSNGWPIIYIEGVVGD